MDIRRYVDRWTIFFITSADVAVCVTPLRLLSCVVKRTGFLVSEHPIHVLFDIVIGEAGIYCSISTSTSLPSSSFPETVPNRFDFNCRTVIRVLARRNIWQRRPIGPRTFVGTPI